MADSKVRRLGRAFGRAVAKARRRASRPQIVFDVGSCNGKEFLDRCKEDPRTHVYAFEPEPKSFQSILQNAAGLPNFHAFQVAISDVDGSRAFNVTSVIGNHSFHEFVDRVDQVWKDPYVKNIPWLPDFKKTDQIKVETSRLDTFIEKMKIPYVSFLHIDAQGEDLKVLRSLGDKAFLVEEGRLEVCLKPLYKGQFTKDEAIAVIKEMGFRVKRIEDEYFGLVENVVFARR